MEGFGGVDVHRTKGGEDVAHALGERVEHLGQVPPLRLAAHCGLVRREVDVAARLVFAPEVQRHVEHFGRGPRDGPSSALFAVGCAHETIRGENVAVMEFRDILHLGVSCTIL